MKILIAVMVSLFVMSCVTPQRKVIEISGVGDFYDPNNKVSFKTRDTLKYAVFENVRYEDALTCNIYSIGISSDENTYLYRSCDLQMNYRWTGRDFSGLRKSMFAGQVADDSAKMYGCGLHSLENNSATLECGFIAKTSRSQIEVIKRKKVSYSYPSVDLVYMLKWSDENKAVYSDILENLKSMYITYKFR